MIEAIHSKQKLLKASSNQTRRKPNNKRPAPQATNKTPQRPFDTTAIIPSETTFASIMESDCKEQNKKVKFTSVSVRQYPRTLGVFDECNSPMDYALALDWIDEKDNDIPTVTTLPLDTYENSKTSNYKSLVEYSELGRLGVADRCRRLLQGMEVADLAQKVGLRHGKTTGRGIRQVEQDLRTFLETVSTSSPTNVLPPFVTNKA